LAQSARAGDANVCTVETRNLRVEASRDNAGRLTLMVPGRHEPMAPTHWSFGQLSGLIGMAIGAESIGSGMKCATVTPVKAATVLPPMIGQGCAKGLDGTANRRTAEASIGAISIGSAWVAPVTHELMMPVRIMPRNAPAEPRRRSVKLTLAEPGRKLTSQLFNIPPVLLYSVTSRGAGVFQTSPAAPARPSTRRRLNANAVLLE